MAQGLVVSSRALFSESAAFRFLVFATAAFTVLAVIAQFGQSGGPAPPPQKASASQPSFATQSAPPPVPANSGMTSSGQANSSPASSGTTNTGPAFSFAQPTAAAPATGQAGITQPPTALAPVAPPPPRASPKLRGIDFNELKQ